MRFLRVRMSREEGQGQKPVEQPSLGQAEEGSHNQGWRRPGQRRWIRRTITKGKRGEFQKADVASSVSHCRAVKEDQASSLMPLRRGLVINDLLQYCLPSTSECIPQEEIIFTSQHRVNSIIVSHFYTLCWNKISTSFAVTSY